MHTFVNLYTQCDFKLRPRSKKNFALLGCYTENSGNFLQTFRGNLPVQTSGKDPWKWDL